MSVVLIILGFFLWSSAARGFASSGGENNTTNLITLILQLTGIGLIIWGVVRFF